MTQADWRTYRKGFLSFATLAVVYFVFHSYPGNNGNGGTVQPVHFENTKSYTDRLSANDRPVSMKNDSEQPDVQHVIIFTIRRSGSTFLSEIFNQNDDYMFFFEPLASYEMMKKKTSDPSLIPDIRSYSKQLLPAIYHCNFTQVPTWTHLPDLCFHLGGYDRIRSLSSYCKSKQFQNDDVNSDGKKYLSSTCRKYKGIAIKTIRVSDIQNLYDLVLDPKLNVKVIYLVRDPRGIINSRYKAVRQFEEVKAKRKDPLLRGGPEPIRPNEVSEICTHMERNLQYWIDTPEWLKGRYKLVRYEDMAGNPISVTRDIYNFIQMPLPVSVTHWLDVNTKQTAGRGKLTNTVTTRNSNVTAYKWQTELQRSVIDDVQLKCKKTLDILGYELV
ncbi:carbohydrate sulfotransferase 1-like [Amphiura filiformis]|uniref:carbohydrate sulfotransferase 1-like n=1 Tax=Amphiura filiformis TaxID=82378 RepID=UPI003B2173A3